jgi:hypothetical protein
MINVTTNVFTTEYQDGGAVWLWNVSRFMVWYPLTASETSFAEYPNELSIFAAAECNKSKYFLRSARVSFSNNSSGFTLRS